MGIFRDWIKQKAWEQLQDEIDSQLRVTPGEYDISTIVDRLGHRIAREYQIPYAKIADYLETRYKEQE